MFPPSPAPAVRPGAERGRQRITVPTRSARLRRAPTIVAALVVALSGACSSLGVDPAGPPQKDDAVTATEDELAGDVPATDGERAGDDPVADGELAGDDPAADDELSGDVPATGGPPTEAPSPTGFEVAPVDWGPCGDGFTDEYECGTLDVPLDHDQPDGDTIELALVRVPAVGDRVGAVVVNPGGPGGSGVDFVASAGTYIVDQLDLSRFDLVGFDPRGVDRSGGLRCLTDAELDDVLYPDDPDAELDDDRFVEACTEEFGDTLAAYSTENTARDMDLMRQAFGDADLSYLGISYGTYLGAMYATLFPERVRALVLDSGFDPTDDTVEEQLTTQLVGFEGAFANWAADCQADPECAFTADDVAGAWDGLQMDLDDSPLIAGDGRTVAGDVMEQATIAALYDELTWSTLSEALAAARDGDPAGLLGLADGFHQRDDDGTYATLRQSNAIITCASGLDVDVPADADADALAAELRAVAPRFGGDIEADDLTDECAGLVPPVDPPDVDFDGDAPILVVGGVNDPATPLRWSEELAEALGRSAGLVTWTGEGHGQLILSECLSRLGAGVLVNLRLPDPGETCGPDPTVPEPEWWADVPVPDLLRGPLPDGSLVVLGVRPTDVYAEAYASAADPDEILRVVEAALVDSGFEPVGVQDVVPGITTLGVLAPGGDVLVVAIVDPAVGGPDLEGVEDLVDDGEVVVLLIHQPT